MSTPAPSKHPARSCEQHGQGQSGYAAGRVADDPSLQQETRNESYPDGHAAEPDSIDTDDRFTGRGSAPRVPGARTSNEDQESK